MENINDWHELFEPMKTDELSELLGIIATILRVRLSDDTACSVYSDLRQEFYYLASCEKPRFSKIQVDMLRPWMSLEKTKQKAFKDKLSFALNWYSAQGIDINVISLRQLVRLVSTSPIFQDGLTLASILESLVSIENLFDDAFPGYRLNGGIHFLRGVMNGDPTPQPATPDS